MSKQLKSGQEIVTLGAQVDVGLADRWDEFCRCFTTRALGYDKKQIFIAALEEFMLLAQQEVCRKLAARFPCPSAGPALQAQLRDLLTRLEQGDLDERAAVAAAELLKAAGIEPPDKKQ